MSLFDGSEFEQWVEQAVAEGKAKIKEAMAAGVFRDPGQPHSEDVVAAVEAGMRHAIEVATGGVGSVATRLNALEARVNAMANTPAVISDSAWQDRMEDAKKQAAAVQIPGSNGQQIKADNPAVTEVGAQQALGTQAGSLDPQGVIAAAASTIEPQGNIESTGTAGA